MKLLLIAFAACCFAGDFPDPKLTPGATLDVPLAKLCKPGYAKSVRNVAPTTKRQVLKEYGITAPKPGEFEIDHLISLELGGSNDIKNLGPQSYITTPLNAHEKDKLEDRLHQLVCNGSVKLEDAQRSIAGDWIGEYGKVLGEH
jgi:hypothetical protein